MSHARAWVNAARRVALGNRFSYHAFPAISRQINHLGSRLPNRTLVNDMLFGPDWLAMTVGRQGVV
jgi:hypothetical protein